MARAQKTVSKKMTVGKKKAARARSHFATADRLRRDGKPEEAVPFYRKAVADDPSWAAPCNDLGVALRKLGRYEEAVESLRDGVKRDPRAVGIHTNLGSALMALDRFEEAEQAHGRAVALAPVDPQPRYQLGLLYKEMERPDLARDAFELCLEADPENAYYQWERVFSILKLGDFAAGWPAYECRFRRGKIPVRSYPQPRWDGGDLAGKTILLYPEQGFGDQIQFARYVPLLAERGARVVLESGPELRRLLTSLPGLAECIPVRAPFDGFDLHAPLLSLPLLLGTRLETLPAKVPYLSPPPRPVPPALADAEGLKVGFVWAGSPTHANDRRRSIPLDVFARLFDRPGVAFYSLQMGKQAEQLATRALPDNVHTVTEAIEDFADSAAVLAQLDLIVTVDTSMAHLAGALGRPTWILLPFSADWRWLTSRRDSPWYPTARLFRQPRPSDWSAVVAGVGEALEALRHSPRPTAAAELPVPELPVPELPVPELPVPKVPVPKVPVPEPAGPRPVARPAPRSLPFERHFIVMGTPGSRTRDIQALLDRHPQVDCRPEDRFQSVLQRAKGLLEATNQELAKAAEDLGRDAPPRFDREDLREIAKAIIGRALRKGIAAPGVERSGTRDNSLFAFDTRFFTELLAGVRIVFVVRDPRASALALWTERAGPDPAVSRGGESLERFADDAAQAWRSRADYGERLGRALGERFHLLRYESLRDNVSGSVAALLHFLEVEPGRESWATDVAALAERAPESASVDWRRQLSATCQERIRRRAGATMVRLDYA